MQHLLRTLWWAAWRCSGSSELGFVKKLGFSRMLIRSLSMVVLDLWFIVRTDGFEHVSYNPFQPFFYAGHNIFASRQ
jgi:hypothetical protein